MSSRSQSSSKNRGEGTGNGCLFVSATAENKDFGSPRDVRLKTGINSLRKKKGHAPIREYNCSERKFNRQNLYMSLRHNFKPSSGKKMNSTQLVAEEQWRQR